MVVRVNSKYQLLLYLGILSTFGPFVMDMYLSAFPMLTGHFAVPSSMVQLSLTSCTFGLGIGQLVFGTVSDRLGRKTPLMFSLVMFMLSTLGCIFSPTIMVFVACRFVQGLAASGGIVLSRSIAADKYGGRTLANMLAIVGTINGVATVASPVCGGIMTEDAGWRGIFWFLFAFGFVLAVCTLKFDETLPRARWQTLSLRDVAGRYLRVAKNKAYAGSVAQYGFAMGLLFVNLSSAPFIMQLHYHLSPGAFSVVFAVNAIALAVSAGMTAKFRTMQQALGLAAKGALLFSVLLGVAFGVGCGFLVYECLVFCIYLMIGIAITSSNVLAMDSERGNAGIASAILGGMAYVAGGVVAPFVGIGGNIMANTALFFIAGSLCSYILWRFSMARFIGGAGE